MPAPSPVNTLNTASATHAAQAGSAIHAAPAGAKTRQFVTFFAGGMHLGADIGQVEEINRLLEVTPVPQAAPFVRGVINLRGEVVTVIDLGALLGLGAVRFTHATRNVIVNFQGERIGLLVDSIGDVVDARREALAPTPQNMRGRDARFYQGVVPLERELLVVLNVDAVLGGEAKRG